MGICRALPGKHGFIDDEAARVAPLGAEVGKKLGKKASDLIKTDFLLNLNSVCVVTLLVLDLLLQ